MSHYRWRPVRRWCTVRPKWHDTGGSVAPVWEVTDDGNFVVIPQRRRLIGGHNEPPDGDYLPCHAQRAVALESLKKEEIAMAVSKNWDKQPPPGAGNKLSRQNLREHVQVERQLDENDELLSYHVTVPHGLGLKLLGALDNILRKALKDNVPVFVGTPNDTGDVYFAAYTVKVETVPVQALHQVEV